MILEWETVIITIVSFVVLVKSADVAVSAISRYAGKVGISEYLIGFLIVSLGTSLPELSTAITSSFSGQGELLLGDVVGANIIDITVVLGLMAIIAKELKIESRMLGKTIFLTMGVVILPFLLGFDGGFSRFDGVLLILSFVFYMFRLWDREGNLGDIKKDVPFKDIYKDMIIFVVSVPLLLLSANFLVASSIKIAYAFNVPLLLIGITLVAIGTTAPELAVEIRSIIKGCKGIAFGDLLGSVVVNSSLVLGLAAVINPITFNISIFVPAITFMVTAVFIGLLFMKQSEITWHEGLGLLLIYVTFLISQGITI